MLDVAIAGLAAVLAEHTVFGALGEHILGSGLHEKLSELERRICERNPGLLGLPTNHDVRRAIRTAELQGLGLVVRNFREQYAPSPEPKVVGAEEWYKAKNLENCLNQI